MPDDLLASVAKVLVVLHIAAGAVGLAALPAALITRKGGLMHRRSGTVFVLGIAATAGTGVASSVLRIMRHGERATAPLFELFLISIGLFTLILVWHGYRFARQRSARAFGPTDYLPAIVVVACFAVVLGFGVANGNGLLIAFPVMGSLVCGLLVLGCRRVSRDPGRRIEEHITGMLGAAISALTALLVVNAGTLERWLEPMGLEVPAFVWWFGPTAVIVPVMVVARRGVRQRQKVAEAAAGPRPAMPSSGNPS